MLTRRAQLALKEEKQRKRKQAEETKKSKKKTVEPEKTDEPEKKPRKRRAKKDKAEKENEETDAVATEKPRKRLRQMKTTDCLPGDVGEQPAPEVPVPEEVPAAPKPKAASKAKSSAKGKAKSQAKAKAEPKRKAAAKKKVEKVENDGKGHDSDEESAPATPKKELFQSDEESSNEDQGDHDPGRHVDPKSGKANRLQEALESCAPDAYKASKRQRSKPNAAVAPRPSGASLEDEADDQVAARKPRKRKPVFEGSLVPICKEGGEAQKAERGCSHEERSS